MASKVRVYAKSQKWAALGIIDAYIKMYPHATVDDLNKAFPLSALQETKTDEPLLVTVTEKEKIVKASKTTFDDEYFEEWKRTHFYVTLPDGTDLMFTVAMWPKEMFEKMLAQAKLYDIEIAKYEAAEKGFGKRGEYRLEYLNGYVPPVPAKKSNKWLWICLAALLIIAILIILLLMKGCQKPAEPQIVEVEKVVVVHDTLYIQQIAEIEKNFNAAEFQQGKADLSESAKFVLHDLAKVLEKNPELRLRLEGHTSAEGDAAFNQKLSEARAQAAVAFLIEHEGIDASRLEALGKGSSELKNTADPMAPENRRTEFIVLE
jgi:outer membrane protein OmpA-like peptidoglycan-associated protein